MTKPKSEPWNPFYVLLIVVGFMFVVTALAYAFVPALEQKARDAGQVPPPSPLRAALRHDGWLWLLYQGGAIAVLAALSMGLDRWRRWRDPDILPTPAAPPSPPPAPDA